MYHFFPFFFLNQSKDTSFDVSFYWISPYTQLTYAFTLSGEDGSVVAWWCLFPVTKVTTHLSIEFSPKRYYYLQLRRPHSSTPDRRYCQYELTTSARICPLQSECSATLQWFEVPPTATPKVCNSTRLPHWSLSVVHSYNDLGCL